MTLLSHNAALLDLVYLENWRLRSGGFPLRSMSQWQSNELFQTRELIGRPLIKSRRSRSLLLRQCPLDPDSILIMSLYSDTTRSGSS